MQDENKTSGLNPEVIYESTAKTFLNTKDTKATKEIQERFESVEPRRRLS